MSNVTTSIVESQPDWLTVTCQDGAMIESLRVEMYRAMQTQEDSGYARHPFAWRGYKGDNCGGVSFGEGQQGAIATLVADCATRYGQKAWRAARHATRLDLAVTVRYQEPLDDIGAHIYALLQRDTPPSVFDLKCMLLVSSGGGQTVYIGSPKSEQRGRVYNKAKETPEMQYRGCWRYEVQYRGEYADSLASRVYATLWGADVVASAVHLWYSSRGIDCPWPYRATDLPSVSFRHQNDVDKRLKWLRTQVAPVIRWLERHGESDRTRIAIGLDRSYTRNDLDSDTRIDQG